MQRIFFVFVVSSLITNAYRVPHTRLRRTAQMAAVTAPENTVEKAAFLTQSIGEDIRSAYGSPVYVYDEKTLINQAKKALQFPNSFGLTVRFAMKASPNKSILQLFDRVGLHFDASSGYECHRAMQAGIPADHISLSSQEKPQDLQELIEKGIKFNACSLDQLETFGKLFPGKECGVRFNPGKGSGGTGKTNVGGPTASFGIWHELLPTVKEIVNKYDIKVVRIHTHIGSGSDPTVWQGVAGSSIALVNEFPLVTTLNLGGGYKVGRMSYENSTDILTVGEPVKKEFELFAQKTGRQLHLEIEPGTFLVANAGCLLCSVQDIVSTKPSGFDFIKLDAGMTEVLRPSLYGAQHPIVILKDTDKTAEYIIVGHCCESGDLFSCAPGDPEALKERTLKKAEIGDLVVIDGAGAYCSGMSTKNYNSFPEAPEVLLDRLGLFHLIRRRQSLHQIIQNELDYFP